MIDTIKQLEYDLIGKIVKISDDDRLVFVFDELSESDFENSYSRIMFGLAKKSYETKGKIETASGMWPLAELAEAMNISVIIGDLFDVVDSIRENGLRRKVRSALSNALSIENPNEAIQKTDIWLSDIRDKAKRDKQNPIAIWEEIRLKAEQNAGRDCIGVETPYHELNIITGGIQGGHLWVLGGYTSSGKSTAANEIVYRAINQGKRVVIFSTEMDIKTTMLRLAGRHSGIPSLAIQRNSFNDEQCDKIEEMFKIMGGMGLVVYDNIYTIEGIRTKAKREKATWENKLDLIVVDFVQNLMGSGSLYERMSVAAVGLQSLAKELDCGVLALSQISNESARDGGGGIIGFKGAGELAAAADVAIIIRPEENYPGKSTMFIQKNRHGQTGKIDVWFRNRYTKLTDKENDQDDRI